MPESACWSACPGWGQRRGYGVIRYSAVVLAVVCLVLAAQGQAAAWEEGQAGGIAPSDMIGSTYGAALAAEVLEDPSADASVVHADGRPAERAWLLIGLGAQSTSYCDQGEVRRGYAACPVLGVEGKITAGFDWNVKTRYIGAIGSDEGITVVTGGLRALYHEGVFPSLVVDLSVGTAWWKRSDFDDEWGIAGTYGLGLQSDNGDYVLMTEGCWAQPRQDWSLGLYLYVRLRI